LIREEDSHRAFRALLEAMSRPGRWRQTPAADAAGALALLRYAAWDGDPHVTFVDASSAASSLATANPGTEDKPELSTTLVVTTDPAIATEVSMRGPGIRDELATSLPLDREALSVRATLCANFPRGVDLVLVDGSGRVLGLPRTSRIVAGG
jgi:alpha-D-ribose 1-methylphosphonate 5-triphosphate synthase subunit PhnH